ncbi:hypothetical protein M153_7030002259 [Pseudoloma neurophilia]|uniref:Uncharacterized protein n=1 Tax=Pseudoloma neurophilia TaxID=146866 RepID=A0A0R0LW93_9MICR|nr:hypothetical protein M153_7030002259 [Pseudoloma neurophilia]
MFFFKENKSFHGVTCNGYNPGKCRGAYSDRVRLSPSTLFPESNCAHWPSIVGKIFHFRFFLTTQIYSKKIFTQSNQETDEKRTLRFAHQNRCGHILVYFRKFS